MIERFTVIVLVIAACMALVVCGGEPEPTPTPIVIIVEITPEPTITPIPRPTETPVPTEVAVVIFPPPTQTPYPTYTPYPTFTPVPFASIPPTAVPSRPPLPTYTPYPTVTPIPPRSIPPTYTPLPTYTPYPTAERLAQNVIAGPTNTPTATPETLLEQGCEESGNTSEFVVPTYANGTTERVEPLEGVVFQDRKVNRDGNEQNAWVFRELSYQHCKVEDPWNPEYLVVDGKQVPPPPRKEGEFVQKVFALSLHQRNQDRTVIYTYIPFHTHPDVQADIRGEQNNLFNNLHLLDESATLYQWTNMDWHCRSGDCRRRPDFMCEEGRWDPDIGCTGGWHWRAVSKGEAEHWDTRYNVPRYERWQTEVWFVLMAKYTTPAVFAIVATGS